MTQIFDPTTWALWVFIPVMRYIFFPSIMEKTLHAYILLIPLFLIGVMAVYFGFASDRAMETLIAGAVLVIMLSFDMLHTTRQIRKVTYELQQSKEHHRNRDSLLI